jgi:hypothetical protein
MFNNATIRLGSLIGVRRLRPVLLAALVIPAGLLAQDAPISSSSVHVDLGKDSPVVVVDSATGESRATTTGSALVIDLHMSLLLRNTSAKRIRSLKLGVVAQEVAVGGKGSVAQPGMNVAPGETFPVPIDLQLMKPAQAAGPLVEVKLDGVLFDDLSFYGSDLNAQRTLTAWEIEAQRDREYFRQVLAKSGPEGLKKEIFASMDRQRLRPQLQWRVPRGPAMTTAAMGPERVEHFAFVQFPDSPVTAVGGYAQVAGNQMRSPRIDVQNRSGKPVKYVELGWLVRDENGEQYMAASLPASGPDLYLPARGTARVLQDKALDLSRSGRPLKIQGMTGFISQVQFSDGKVWAPSRQDLDDPALRKALPPSAEEQRLTDIYRTKGLSALMIELKK